MAEPRVFTRLRAEVPAQASGFATVPPGGMCLSVFLLLSPAGEPSRVLLGKVDPRAAWEEIGNLDPTRAKALEGAWMIPSSHLLRFEAPDDAARRVAREQLGLTSPVLSGPRVVSEAYGRPERPPGELHWDLHFLYTGTWPAGRALTARPWRELAFVDPASVPSGGIGRGHADILALARAGPARRDGSGPTDTVI